MLGMSGVEGVAEAGAHPRGGLKVFAKRARKYGRSPSAPVGRSAITLCRLCALSFLAYPSCANIPPRHLELSDSTDFSGKALKPSRSLEMVKHYPHLGSSTASTI
jgi:hypothetical protein